MFSNKLLYLLSRSVRKNVMELSLFRQLPQVQQHLNSYYHTSKTISGRKTGATAHDPKPRSFSKRQIKRR